MIEWERAPGIQAGDLQLEMGRAACVGNVFLEKYHQSQSWNSSLVSSCVGLVQSGQYSFHHCSPFLYFLFFNIFDLTSLSTQLRDVRERRNAGTCMMKVTKIVIIGWKDFVDLQTEIAGTGMNCKKKSIYMRSRPN